MSTETKHTPGALRAATLWLEPRKGRLDDADNVDSLAELIDAETHAPAREILRKMLETGGAVISSDSCHPAEIAIARATGNFALLDHYGLILKPARWVKSAQDAHSARMESLRDAELFRALLHKHGAGNPGGYDWHNGEALYLGDPIAGRANESERAAIAEMSRAAIAKAKGETP